jgi:hypothetical protein
MKISRTNFTCSLYGREIWSLHFTGWTWGGGAFENTVLRRGFGPKRDEIMGEWRKLHNEELHNVYSPDALRTME